MTNFKDYYRVLGAHRNSNKFEIVACYLQAMKDARSISDHVAMGLIQEAYNTLSSEGKTQYDAFWDSFKGTVIEGRKDTSNDQASNNQIAVQGAQSGTLAIDFSNFIDLYHALNVPRSADVEMMKKAYQQLVDLYNQGHLGEERGKGLVALGSKALEILSNPALKTQYDLLWDQVNGIAPIETKPEENTWRTTEPIPYQQNNTYSAPLTDIPIVAYINSEIIKKGKFQKPSNHLLDDMVSLKKLYCVIQDDLSVVFARETGAFSDYYRLETVPGKHIIAGPYSYSDRPWFHSDSFVQNGHRTLIIPAVKFVTPELIRLGWLTDKISIKDIGKLQTYIMDMIIDTPQVFVQALESAAKKDKRI